MTLTDALAAALDDAIDDCPEVGWADPLTSDLRPADVKKAIRAALAAPAFRKALTAALAEELERLPPIPDRFLLRKEWVASDWVPNARDYSAAIVDRLLPV